MGFGYDELNLERLELSKTLLPDIPIHGTAIGISDGERQDTERLLAKCAGRATSGGGIMLKAYENLPFIKEMGEGVLEGS